MRQLNLLNLCDAPPVQYWPSFLNRAQADALLERSLVLEWQQNYMKMFNKSIALPRLEAMFGDSEQFFYIYSNSVELRAKPWPSFLCKLRSQVENQTGHS